MAQPVYSNIDIEKSICYIINSGVRRCNPFGENISEEKKQYGILNGALCTSKKEFESIISYLLTDVLLNLNMIFSLG
jgi:hypothetical protein